MPTAHGAPAAGGASPAEFRPSRMQYGAGWLHASRRRIAPYSDRIASYGEEMGTGTGVAVGFVPLPSCPLKPEPQQYV